MYTVLPTMYTAVLVPCRPRARLPPSRLRFTRHRPPTSTLQPGRQSSIKRPGHVGGKAGHVTLAKRLAVMCTIRTLHTTGGTRSKLFISQMQSRYSQNAVQILSRHSRDAAEITRQRQRSSWLLDLHPQTEPCRYIPRASTTPQTGLTALQTGLTAPQTGLTASQTGLTAPQTA